MGCSVTFLLVHRLLGILGLGPAPDQKDVEIAVLRHQFIVLGRQTARPRYTYGQATQTPQVLGSNPRGRTFPQRR
jgi:hypothetical protein